MCATTDSTFIAEATASLHRRKLSFQASCRGADLGLALPVASFSTRRVAGIHRSVRARNLAERHHATTLERIGNFSQSANSNGKLVVITDPNSGAPFPGNIIPASRINSVGQATLNYLPTPNYFPAPGSSDYNNYNYTNLGSAPHPVRDTVVRGDVNLTSKLSGYFRWTSNHDEQQALYQGVQWVTSTTDPSKQLVKRSHQPWRRLCCLRNLHHFAHYDRPDHIRA